MKVSSYQKFDYGPVHHCNVLLFLCSLTHCHVMITWMSLSLPSLSYRYKRQSHRTQAAVCSLDVIHYYEQVLCLYFKAPWFFYWFSEKPQALSSLISGVYVGHCLPFHHSAIDPNGCSISVPHDTTLHAGCGLRILGLKLPAPLWASSGKYQEQ